MGDMNDSNIERDIAICNNYVENGEWLYNLTRSIADAEEELPSNPNSNLTNTLHDILNTETVDPLMLEFNCDAADKEPLNEQPNHSSAVKQPLSKLEKIVNDNNEYLGFLSYHKTSWRNHSRARIVETEKDLFSFDTRYSLAHCVSEDMWLNNGIARSFRSRFDRVCELYAQKQEPGGLAVLSNNEQYLYYLVTKKVSTDETVLQILFNSLNQMCKHIIKNNVKYLAMPKTITDFDGVKWNKVKPMLEYLLRDIVITIKVCEVPLATNLFVPLELTKSRVLIVDYPLVDIEEDTMVIYYGLEDGFITDEIRSLNTKFRFIIDYRMASRKVGEVITAYKMDRKYLLCGLIVNKNKDEKFDFVNFQKCICALTKLNGKRQNKYKYLGIEAIQDEDPLIMNKIVNIVQYSFRSKIEIYVCWPSSRNLQMLLPVNKNWECI